MNAAVERGTLTMVWTEYGMVEENDKDEDEDEGESMETGEYAMEDNEMNQPRARTNKRNEDTRIKLEFLKIAGCMKYNGWCRKKFSNICMDGERLGPFTQTMFTFELFLCMATETNESTQRNNTLIIRKPCFGLPTGCPQCLSAFIFLKFSELPFNLDYHLNYPDSDQIPYFEAGDCVAYNNEQEGIIECLKRDVGDLDSEVSSLPHWIPTKVMLTTWLADALEYELWVGCDGSAAYNIYYSDLPWPIGKVLFWKKAHWVKQKHEISKENAEVKEEEIYGRANAAYDALSTLLGEQNYLFENRPSSLDAIFLAHALVVLQALPESSILRTDFLGHSNLVRYVQQCKTELIEAGTSPSSDPHFHEDPSSSASKGRSTSSSKTKSKSKRQPQTKEEKIFKRRAKYFVVAQLVAVVLFLSVISGYSNNADMELDDGDVGYGSNE